ncbi:MAG: ABC transporter substrate-binding protein [Melioribacteraceae bacterium]|nr:ABC transporter substrate-binding protein [Melioribacteraceae bacterium]MCF8265672.1 ABC transporter substrate-binding protein [Melioribacteraceae bacterium]MCF8414486.1 ABC transporter substrate-binding protein [Melioribacteraceae bacterium]
MKKLIILIIVSIIFINSCGGDEKNDDKKTVIFWHSFVSSTVPALNALIEDFEKTHPDINIEAQYIPSGDALVQKLITSIQSETAPDISWLHAHFMEDLVQADAIYKMEKFIKGPNGISEADLNDIYPALLQYASWRGTLYSMPMEATNLALLYNKDMFRAAGLDPERPPQNWDELVEYSKKLTFDKDGDGKNEQTGLFLPVYPAAGPLSGWMVWQFHPYLWQAGGYKINLAQTEVIYNDEAGIKALRLWKKIYHDLDLNVFTSDYDVAFASRNLAMAMDGPWNLPRYEEILTGMDWAFAPLPSGPEKKATIVGGEYLAIFKQSEHPEAAWAFIKWIIQPETQAKWAMTSGYLPIRRAVKEVPEFKQYLEDNPNFKVFIDQMEFGQAERPIDYGGMEIMRHIADAIEKSTVGNQDVQEALNESAKLSNKVLNEANQKHK